MDVRGEILALLGTTVRIARVSKKEIGHEGEAYLIQYFAGPVSSKSQGLGSP
jgi:hypothetical protein